MGYLKTKQKLGIDLDTAWDFFSSPKNLKEITPSYMGFDITSGNQDEKIYPGMIITYKVSPLLNIPMNWMTEITQVNPGKYFIDEQLFGPYKIWHHEHHFKEIEGGVEMIDILHYKAPLGFLGNLAENLIVRKKVKEIFDFREQKLEQLFPFS